MSKKEYVSHIDKAVDHTTAKGGSFVEPFDLVRSTDGRATIRRHAAMKSTSSEISKSTIGAKGSSRLVREAKS